MEDNKDFTQAYRGSPWSSTKHGGDHLQHGLSHRRAGDWRGDPESTG